jgi:zinc transport system substrate-binding protein
VKKILPILILIIFALTACASKTNEVVENKINVVTSFYPIYIAAINVVDGVEDVNLSNLASPQVGCLHDYQITTQDMLTLENADVLIINGAGMESFVDKAVERYNNLKILNASDGIEIIKNDENAEQEENAHVWVSITNHIKQVENIRDYMMNIDPANADKYENNAEKYISKLNVLKTEIQNELQNIENKDIVTFHEAFEYFANEFGLNVVAVIENEPGIEPSAGELADTIETIRNSKVNAIFIEPQYSRTSADVIANELGIKIYMLDPIVTGELNKNEYINKMKTNLENLKEALGTNK